MTAEDMLKVGEEVVVLGQKSKSMCLPSTVLAAEVARSFVCLEVSLDMLSIAQSSLLLLSLKTNERLN